MKIKLISAVAGLVLSAAAASAASISVSQFSVSAYNTQLATLSTPVIENFESYAVGNVPGAGFSTSVGTFTSLGGTGSGRTVTDPNPDLDGTRLAIRTGEVYGRSSTTDLLAGISDSSSDGRMDRFLDSNDTWGISWDVNVGRLFNKLIFTLTDATDQGATITISATGASPVSFATMSNRDRRLVVVDFGAFISNATITLRNTTGVNGPNRINDGFSIDDVAVSAVPLPAPALMLIAGLGGLAALRRKRAAA